MMYDYWGQNGSNGSNGAWSFIFMLFMMALVFVGFIAVLRYLHRDSGRRQSGGDALDIVEKRYAQGEIDTKEFEEKRKTLNE